MKNTSFKGCTHWTYCWRWSREGLNGHCSPCTVQRLLSLHVGQGLMQPLVSVWMHEYVIIVHARLMGGCLAQGWALLW